jgi:ABC-type glycerol-3-phosphate transport system substrate-binding protein
VPNDDDDDDDDNDNNNNNVKLLISTKVPIFFYNGSVVSDFKYDPDELTDILYLTWADFVHLAQKYSKKRYW